MCLYALTEYTVMNPFVLSIIFCFYFEGKITLSLLPNKSLSVYLFTGGGSIQILYLTKTVSIAMYRVNIVQVKVLHSKPLKYRSSLLSAKCTSK